MEAPFECALDLFMAVEGKDEGGGREEAGEKCGREETAWGDLRNGESSNMFSSSDSSDRIELMVLTLRRVES